MDIVIRPADFTNPLHRDGLVDVIDSYARDPIGGGAPLPADVRERLVPALREHPTAMVLMAFAAERPVGVAVCFLGFSTFQARPLMNIHDLAIVPDWRGKGVGRALLEAVEIAARDRGCCKLTLEVLDDNVRARALYERCGFKEFVLGDSEPARFLTKPIHPAPQRAEDSENGRTKP